jgi:glyoxylase-like metal-dependent hydrolase (beta-lactamase superfamily II)
MTDFTEVADRVWVARHTFFDVNVSVVGGARGLVVVDTHGSTPAGRGVVDDVRRLVGPGVEVVGVVNTHCHFDHTFGNEAFREAWPQVPIHAHETVPRDLAESERRIRRAYAANPDDPHGSDLEQTTLVLPDHTFSSAAGIDLGDRLVELVHPGLGHTAGDIVVRVDDADAVLAGDLVESSAPPAYGEDCHPLAWPATLDFVLQLVTDATVVVPGHGAPVDRGFVLDQRDDVGVVAATLRDLAGRGVPPEQALEAADWPFPTDRLVDAVRRGYAQLPPGGRRLPLA